MAWVGAADQKLAASRAAAAIPLFVPFTKFTVS